MLFNSISGKKSWSSIWKQRHRGFNGYFGKRFHSQKNLIKWTAFTCHPHREFRLSRQHSRFGYCGKCRFQDEVLFKGEILIVGKKSSVFWLVTIHFPPLITSPIRLIPRMYPFRKTGRCWTGLPVRSTCLLRERDRQAQTNDLYSNRLKFHQINLEISFDSAFTFGSLKIHTPCQLQVPMFWGADDGKTQFNSALNLPKGFLISSQSVKIKCLDKNN